MLGRAGQSAAEPRGRLVTSPFDRYTLCDTSLTRGGGIEVRDQLAANPTAPKTDDAPLLEELRSSFYRVGQALASSPDLGETLRLIADLTADIMRAQAATVHLVEDDGRGIVLKASSGPTSAILERLQVAYSDALIDGIIRHRQAVQVPRLLQTYSAADLSDAQGREIGAYLGVPLLLRGQVMGVLAIARRDSAVFSAAEVELLSSFASQAAVAIENSRLFAALQDKLREMSGLYEVSLAFGAMSRLEDTYAELVARIGKLLDVERCVILLPDYEHREFAAQPQALGLTPEQAETMRLPMDGEYASARVWRSGRPYLTNAAQSDPRNLHQYTLALNDRSLLIVPMVAEGKPFGLLRASNKRSGRFHNGDVRLLTIFAMQAAIVVRSAILFREVAQERQRLKAIFDNASDGIAIIGRDRRIIEMNPAMERLTGWRAGEAAGAKCSEVYNSHDERGFSLCKLACPVLRFQNAEPVQPYIETVITTRDGRERDVAISYSPIMSRAQSGSDATTAGQFVAIVRAIPYSKEIERTKTQFVSTVSHELRTPLAAIKASTGVLMASMPAETPEPLMRLLRNIDRSTQRLESIVSDLLDLSRLQSGRVQLSLRTIDLNEVASEAVATVRPLADDKQQALTLSLPKRPSLINGDRQRLGQVLINLLSNAVKYTPSRGRIVVSVSRQNGEVVCGVEDDGPGIPAEEQDRIFERFYRPENATTQANQGTGLGLPIAKALIELHEGRIWMRSESGRGSAFYIALRELDPDEARGGAALDHTTARPQRPARTPS